MTSPEYDDPNQAIEQSTSGGMSHTDPGGENTFEQQPVVFDSYDKYVWRFSRSSNLPDDGEPDDSISITDRLIEEAALRHNREGFADGEDPAMHAIATMKPGDVKDAIRADKRQARPKSALEMAKEKLEKQQHPKRVAYAIGAASVNFAYVSQLHTPLLYGLFPFVAAAVTGGIAYSSFETSPEKLQRLAKKEVKKLQKEQQRCAES